MEEEKQVQKQEDVYSTGEVFYAYFRFDEGGEKGKHRPIVAMRNEEDETWKALKVTSRIAKKINHKYGYLLKHWEEVGLERPSIVKCNREDIIDIDPQNIVKKLGDLSEADLKGLFVKLLKVKDIEYRRDQQKINEIER
ncbi:type II toxin-antitoxin system PemK/MazF family toxin [Metasolibacillus meyeri]|uniref:Type II toxin-antitoxin system PemK/MazF family toxin n=1 Tax=Metasolibacillus meyeri TaxID=1071052 RepID=A0AAW9NSR7_9BACL|nr:type II toxin-antitoxin system PemK/MazF family toxin [Metasolibacillus meyeri]MEC1177248.1 type II toxin-antitoxin system PemK/MazF family toxin [Metasolibacillus meyeri]